MVSLFPTLQPLASSSEKPYVPIIPSRSSVPPLSPDERIASSAKVTLSSPPEGPAPSAPPLSLLVEKEAHLPFAAELPGAKPTPVQPQESPGVNVALSLIKQMNFLATLEQEKKRSFFDFGRSKAKDPLTLLLQNEDLKKTPEIRLKAALAIANTPKEKEMLQLALAQHYFETGRVEEASQLLKSSDSNGIMPTPCVIEPKQEVEKPKDPEPVKAIYNKDVMQADLSIWSKESDPNAIFEHARSIYYPASSSELNLEQWINVVKLYETAARKGQEEAARLLSTVYANRDPARAFEFHMILARDHRCPKAMYLVAACFWVGTGIARDIVKSVEYMTKAKKAGSEEAEKDYSSNAALYEMIKQASKTGSISYQIARWLDPACPQEVSIKLPKKAQDAFKWYLQAAKLKHAEARKKVIQCYSEGIGVEKSEALAKQWTEKL